MPTSEIVLLCVNWNKELNWITLAALLLALAVAESLDGDCEVLVETDGGHGEPFALVGEAGLDQHLRPRFLTH